MDNFEKGMGLAPEQEKSDEEKEKGYRKRIAYAFMAISDDDKLAEQFQSEQIELANKIKTAVPNYLEYKMYHVLAGGSYTKDDAVPYFDFEGDLSVVKFIEDWENKRKDNTL